MQKKVKKVFCKQTKTTHSKLGQGQNKTEKVTRNTVLEGSTISS